MIGLGSEANTTSEGVLVDGGARLAGMHWRSEGQYEGFKHGCLGLRLVIVINKRTAADALSVMGGGVSFK